MLQNTIKDLRTAIIAFVVFSVLLGLAYPYAITGIAQAVFNRQANGSLVEPMARSSAPRSSARTSAHPPYFHPRPSAAGADGYDASASSGSNLGPSSQVLATTVAGRVDTVRSDEGLAPDAKVPVDAVTSSGKRPRPAHLARLRTAPDRARRARTGWGRRERHQGDRRQVHRRIDTRGAG